MPAGLRGQTALSGGAVVPGLCTIASAAMHGTSITLNQA